MKRPAFGLSCSALLTLTLSILPAAGMAKAPSVADPSSPLRAELACAELRGWKEVFAYSEGAILLFGELHGTKELPARFTDYVCHVARTGAPVIVGIETWPEDSEGIEHGMTLDDDGTFWAENLMLFTSTNDGRNSSAVLRMLLDIRSMKKMGFDIDVVPIAPTLDHVEAYEGKLTGDMNSRRFAAEAEILTKIHREGPRDARIVVYHGNLHAMRVGRQVLGETPLFDQSLFVRLNYVTNGGAAWNCQMTCGPHIIKRPSGKISEIRATGLHLNIDPDIRPPFDGWFYVEEVSPSFPVGSE